MATRYFSPYFIENNNHIGLCPRAVSSTARIGLLLIGLLFHGTAADTVAVSLTPNAITLTSSQIRTFKATVSGGGNASVAWSITPAVGTVSSGGVYTAPSTIAAAQTVIVKATSVADGSESASATIKLNPPVGVSSTPAITLNHAHTEFSAAVTRASSPAVTWGLGPPIGTVSNAGMYTAAASRSDAQTVPAIGQSTVNPAKSASAAVTPRPAKFAISVSPASVSLAASQSQTFKAHVTGIANSAVTWLLSPAVGTISASGVYTAPSTVSAAQTIAVKAASVANPAISGSASVVLDPPVSISLTPATATLLPSQPLLLTSTVSGTSNTGVTWTLNPAVGSYVSSGATATYIAPSTAPAPQTVTIAATSMADPTKSAAAVLALMQAVTVAVSPSSVTLGPSGTQQFTAAVSGSSNTAVTWSVSPPLGTISTAGLYTAPASLPTAQTVTVNAQSGANPTKSGSTLVSLQPPAQVEFTIDANGLTSLSYAGQIYYLARPYFEVGNVIFRSPAGTEKNTGWALPATKTLGTNPADYFQHVYGTGQPDSYTLKVVWSTPDSRTLQVDTYVTNNDSADTLARIDLALLNLQIPAQALQFNGNIPLSIGQPSDALPVGFLSNTWGSLAFWVGDYSKTTTLGAPYGNGQTQFNFWLDNYAQRPYGTGTKHYETDIAPGATQLLTYFLRFGGPSDTPATLAPEGFTLYRAAFPNLLQWTDRRPIANWFISQGTDASAFNPRGYLSNSALDISNSATFGAAVLAKADDVISRMNKITPQPQGIVIWDLEGQEFYQYFTYVGHPDRLPQISPEMDAVADQLFAKFRNAGYLVGLTIRPNDFQAGSSLPTTCQSGTQVGQRDVFVKVDAAFPYRGYECATANAWSQDGPQQPYFQTIFDDDDAILTNLSQKVAYAHNRWNARLFYVDSNVYLTTGGAIAPTIFRALMQQFPDCLFMPEWKNAFYAGATAPYSQPNMGTSYTPASWKWVYPNAFSLISIGASDLAAQYNDLLFGVQSGDVMLFRAWYDSPEIPVMQQLYTVAAQAK